MTVCGDESKRWGVEMCEAEKIVRLCMEMKEVSDK